MLVLEIGANIKPQAKYVWENATIETMDADAAQNPTYVNDARKMPEHLYGKFDAVFASHVLEHIPYWEAHAALIEWGKVIKPGGELHIVVPSLEWAAEQILSEKPSKAIMPHLFAGLTTAWDVHLSGYTMRNLRSYMEIAGYRVIRARSGPYTLLVDKVPHEAEQHYVAGIKEG
jgi:predicted SAM-dependent methyltransferase